jgi:hypothetical protein
MLSEFSYTSYKFINKLITDNGDIFVEDQEKRYVEPSPEKVQISM